MKYVVVRDTPAGTRKLRQHRTIEAESAIEAVINMMPRPGELTYVRRADDENELP